MYEDFPTDDERKQHLQDDGYTIGRATGHRCNSLIDSLLQSLLASDIINGPSADEKPLLWRNEVCELTRKHLCEHADISMHPRVRSQAGEAVLVAPDVHARAFLQHYKHANEIILFLFRKPT